MEDAPCHKWWKGLRNALDSQWSTVARGPILLLFWIAANAVRSEERDGSLLCRVCQHPEPLFSIPCDSSLIGVLKYKKHDTVLRWIQKDNQKKKAIKIPVGEKVIFMAILHDIAVCCHLRSHQCLIIAISYTDTIILYCIKLTSLFLITKCISWSFLGKRLVYWPVIGLQKREM